MRDPIFDVLTDNIDTIIRDETRPLGKDEIYFELNDDVLDQIWKRLYSDATDCEALWDALIDDDEFLKNAVDVVNDRQIDKVVSMIHHTQKILRKTASNLAEEYKAQVIRFYKDSMMPSDE